MSETGRPKDHKSFLQRAWVEFVSVSLVSIPRGALRGCFSPDPSGAALCTQSSLRNSERNPPCAHFCCNPRNEEPPLHLWEIRLLQHNWTAVVGRVVKTPNYMIRAYPRQRNACLLQPCQHPFSHFMCPTQTPFSFCWLVKQMLILVTDLSIRYLRVLYLITVSRDIKKYPHYTRQHQKIRSPNELEGCCSWRKYNLAEQHQNKIQPNWISNCS